MRADRLAPAAATALAIALAAAGHGAVASPAPIVFFDIAGTNLPSQATFYRNVFDWQSDANGRLLVPAATPLPGLLRIEPPTQTSVAERLIYIGVPDINATLAKIRSSGGQVVLPRTAAPGAIIALFRDPAGNRMGLVEMDGNKPRAPPPR